ncbi:sulfite exporter TauE/SafE family protein [Limibacter armeniacum]|uniref:sulfite exporter TauE/SafE family protein n=1 Tax=Limibacter armeniacum TaxID=466084 RepID=UPI002FE6B748
MEVLGYAGAIAIGVSLGLIGGGGSILTVPVLVYLLHIDPVLSTAYSLFIVGSASLVGAVGNMKKGLVSYKTAIIFGLPSMAAVFLTRKFLVPAIPDHLMDIGNFELTKPVMMMLVFAVMMLLASVSMIKGRSQENCQSQLEPSKNQYLMLLVQGVLIGTLTAFVGAGGGFLIIPALVVLAKLPMKTAIGTSLTLIAFNSLFGFIGDVLQRDIAWSFLLIFAALAVAGIFIGMKLAEYIPGYKLKKGFGWFVVIMGVWVLSKELIF